MKKKSRETNDPKAAESEKALRAQLDLERLPRHIALIPDGNGRWAKGKGWADRIKGHEAGIDAIRMMIEECASLHIDALSIYAFSRDNWTRSRHETSTLMRFFKKFLIVERDRLKKNDIRLIHTGCREDLPKYVLKELDKTIDLTAKNNGMTLNLSVSYSGREEIANAARRLAEMAARGELDPADITPERFSHNLYHPDLGDPDLLIRTSGENRISDFMLYQISYTELWFASVLWPDFSKTHLYEALLSYKNRERRFGGVKG